MRLFRILPPAQKIGAFHKIIGDTLLPFNRKADGQGRFLELLKYRLNTPDVGIPGGIGDIPVHLGNYRLGIGGEDVVVGVRFGVLQRAEYPLGLRVVVAGRGGDAEFPRFLVDDSAVLHHHKSPLFRPAVGVNVHVLFRRHVTRRFPWRGSNSS